MAGLYFGDMFKSFRHLWISPRNTILPQMPAVAKTSLLLFLFCVKVSFTVLLHADTGVNAGKK